MRARLVVACSAVLVVLAFWMAGAGTRPTSAQAAPAARKHFLEVGKKYELLNVGVNIDMKVLEEPRDHWVKVELDTEKPKRVWLNLDQILSIEEK